VSDEKKESGGGLSVQTLLISSVAAVVATVVVSQFWEKGTLFFTAMVPIVVAITSEALKRPAEKITQVAPLVAPLKPARRGPTGTAPHEPAIPEEARRTFPDEGAEPPPRREDRFGLYEDEPRRGQFLRSRGVRVGLVTGLIAFLIGAAVVTASELALFNGSVGGGERRTTLLGGSSSRTSDREEEDREATPTPEATETPSTERATPTPEGEEATPTPSPGASPTPTPTPSPGATPTPAPGAAPPGAQATPAP
jgi:hypothetical protein